MKHKYRIQVQSVPGPFAQYGPWWITAWVDDDEDLLHGAVRELKRGAFHDRTLDMWRVVSSERIS